MGAAGERGCCGGGKPAGGQGGRQVLWLWQGMPDSFARGLGKRCWHCRLPAREAAVGRCGCRRRHAPTQLAASSSHSLHLCLLQCQSPRHPTHHPRLSPAAAAAAVHGGQVRGPDLCLHGRLNLPHRPQLPLCLRVQRSGGWMRRARSSQQAVEAPVAVAAACALQHGCLRSARSLLHSDSVFCPAWPSR